MFPLYDDIKAARFPIVTILLIAINAYVFFLELTTPNLNAFIAHYALTPANVQFNNPQTLLPFLTSMFLHGGWLHILSNMWFLWIFGDNVEGYLGKLQYLGLYLISGLIGNFLQYIVMPHSTVPMLGASGAIAGVLGAYFLLFPHAKVRTLIFIFFFVTLINVAAPIILGYWFLLQLFSGLTEIGQTSAGAGVAFFAHIGGFIAGLILARTMQLSEQNVIEGEVVHG